MQTFRQMISGVHDYCGRVPKEVLESHDFAFYLMKEIDRANLELINASKSHADYKFVTTLTTKEGTLSADADKVTNYEICYEILNDNRLLEIPIYEDAEDLVRMERLGRRGILLKGMESTTYALSFTPDQPITVQLWSKKLLIAVGASVDASTGMIGIFDNLLVQRASIKALDDLLLPHILEKHGDFTRFVNARKMTLTEELDSTEYYWYLYISGANDDGGVIVRDTVDPFDFYGMPV